MMGVIRAVALLAVVIAGCDRFFVVKGRVAAPPLGPAYEFTGSISDPGLAPLPEVRIVLFYSRDDKITELADRGSDAQGRFRIDISGSPFGSLTKNLFLEFRKSGYKTRRVSLAGEPTDRTVQRNQCSDQERKPCWELSVVLIPESQAK